MGSHVVQKEGGGATRAGRQAPDRNIGWKVGASAEAKGSLPMAVLGPPAERNVPRLHGGCFYLLLNLGAGVVGASK